MGEGHLNQVVKWMALDLSDIIDWNEDEGLNVHSLSTPTHANAYDIEYWKKIASSTFFLDKAKVISNKGFKLEIA